MKECIDVLRISRRARNAEKYRAEVQTELDELMTYSSVERSAKDE